MQTRVGGKMRIAIIVGSVAPYRHRVFEAFSDRYPVSVTVLACEALEPQRSWSVPEPRNYTLTVLPGLRYHKSRVSHVYFNPAVITNLVLLKPDIILISDFTPTMLLAACYARFFAIPYGINTDGHRGTDPGEHSRLHGLARKVLIPRAAFGIGASAASIELLTHWGLDIASCVEVPLTPPWDAPIRIPSFDERPYDLLFAGFIDERHKGALFFAEMLRVMRTRGLNPRVRIVGDGPDRAELQRRLRDMGINHTVEDLKRPEEMAATYVSARLLVFPSRGDAWGLVANEAVLCGTPVLGSPHAQSSRQLLEHFGVGEMRPLEADVWADCAGQIISDRAAWEKYMLGRDAATHWFAVDRAVEQLMSAFEVGAKSRVATT